MFGVLAAGCGSSGTRDCLQSREGAQVEIQETGEALSVKCLDSGYYGQSETPTSRRFVRIETEKGLRFELKFHSTDLIAPLRVSLPGAPEQFQDGADHVDWQDTFNVIDLRAIQQRLKYLCQIPEGAENPNQAMSGFVEFDTLRLGPDRRIEEFHGEFEVNLSGCSFPETAVNSRDITVRGRF